MGTVLSILLTVLKWIGLILLWILIVIAAIILLVVLLLTIPIRVRALGAFDQKKEILDLNADISYFLKLVHVRVFLKDKKIAWQLKIAGKTIRSSKPPDEAETKPAETAETNETAAAEPIENSSAEPYTEPENELDEGSEKQPENEPEKKSADEATSEEGIPDWAVELMQPIGPNKIEALEEKIGALLAKVDRYYDLYERAPGKRKVIRALFRMIGRMLRQFWFQDSKIVAVYGLADPGTMGTIQAVVGMLGCYIPDKGLRLEVDPDFEEENIHVDADLKLRIHIQAFIHYALCFAFNWHVLRLVIYVIRSLRQEKTDGKKKQEQEQCADHAVERSNS